MLSSPIQDNEQINGLVLTSENPQQRIFERRMAHVTITLTERVDAPVQKVFDFVTAKNVLPKILLGYGILPRVVSTSESVGPWDEPGSFRTVHLSNRTSAREELTEYKPFDYFAYRTSDFTSVLKYVVRQGRGQWRFTPDGLGTRIVWTYTFTASHWFMKTVLEIFVSLLWRGYMRGALRQVKAQTERLEATASL